MIYRYGLPSVTKYGIPSYDFNKITPVYDGCPDPQQDEQAINILKNLSRNEILKVIKEKLKELNDVVDKLDELA